MEGYSGRMGWYLELAAENVAVADTQITDLFNSIIFSFSEKSNFWLEISGRREFWLGFSLTISKTNVFCAGKIKDGF